jgi:anti-sigma B factor antagonist
MPVKMEEKKGLTICYVEGEIDINSAPEIRKSFEKLISKKEPKILINFTKVTYVDSSGLATLVEILKNMRTYGGRLKLTNLAPKIKSLFEITKLEKLFDIASEEDEAITNFI